MAWMQCRDCGAKFAIGLLRCPQCNAMSELYAVPEEVIEAEQEATVPKISVGGGPSNALGQPLEAEAPATEPPEAPEHLEPEMSDATSDATNGEAEPEEGAAVGDAASQEAPAVVEPESAPAPKPAKKTAAKKTAAKQESVPKG